MINALRNLFFHDFWLKLFSLVLALAIWGVVSLAIQREVPPTDNPIAILEEHTFTGVPVLVVSTAQDVRSFKVEPAEVEVTVRGDSKLLQSLKSSEIRALVDLTGIESAHSLRKRIEVSTPTGVSHARVFPEEVNVIVPPKR
jgi:YbbR domain-containing protein